MMMGKKQREDFAHAANGHAPRPAAEFDPKVVQRIVSYLLPEGESDSKEIRHKNDNALHRAIQYISCLFRGDQITIEPKGLSDQYINQLSSAEDIRTPLYGRVMRGATFYIKHERTPHASLEFDLYQDVLYLALALDLDHHVSDAKTFLFV